MGGAGADLEVVREPGGAGESDCELAIGRLLDGRIEGADGAGEGGVDAVVLREGGLEDFGQVIDIEASDSSAAETFDDLLGA